MAPCLETSFDRRVPFLGHQASTLLLRFASLGRVCLDLPDDTSDSLRVDGDEGLHFLRPGRHRPNRLNASEGRVRCGLAEYRAHV